jgi:flagellar basal-body rod protein FlgG
MYAQQLNVDTIANNLANVNTTGFKKSRPEFQDLMYQTLKASSTSHTPEIHEATEIQVGNGAVPVATQRSFTQGDMAPTNNPLDIAVEGEGFLQVRRPDGTIAYTRDGTLKMSPEGTLVTSQGYSLEPAVSTPDQITSLTIGRDGVVEVSVVGDATPVQAGQFEIAKFVNPAGLRAIGGNLYIETAASGKPIVGAPGTEGFGELRQGQLESSNVDVVEEMVSMIVAQRAYEINSKTVKTVEDMLTMANNIKRG